VRTAKADVAAFRRGRAGALCDGDPDRLDTTILVQAFAAGDAWTRRVIGETTNCLGQALAALHLGVGIESFIIIGGFAQALGENYRLMLAEGAGAASWNVGQDWGVMIRLGASEDGDALIGAGRYAVRMSAETALRATPA
jgi:glucokinase